MPSPEPMRHVFMGTCIPLVVEPAMAGLTVPLPAPLDPPCAEFGESAGLAPALCPAPTPATTLAL